MSKASTSDRIIHEGKGYGKVAVALVLGIIFLPGLLGGLLQISGPSAAKMTYPAPGNAKRTYGDQATTPTTAAPRTLSQEELDARAKAKEIGDGLAKAKAQPSAPVDARGGLPEIGQAGGGSLLGELVPGVEGTLRAIGPGLTKALNP